jgi:hypothetical protein
MNEVPAPTTTTSQCRRNQMGSKDCFSDMIRTITEGHRKAIGQNLKMARQIKAAREMCEIILMLPEVRYGLSIIGIRVLAEIKRLFPGLVSEPAGDPSPPRRSPKTLDEKEKLCQPIQALHISPRTANRLESMKISTVGELLNTPHEVLESERWIGEKTIAEIKTALARFGLGVSVEKGLEAEVEEDTLRREEPRRREDAAKIRRRRRSHYVEIEHVEAAGFAHGLRRSRMTFLHSLVITPEQAARMWKLGVCRKNQLRALLRKIQGDAPQDSKKRGS